MTTSSVNINNAMIYGILIILILIVLAYFTGLLYKILRTFMGDATPEFLNIKSIVNPNGTVSLKGGSVIGQPNGSTQPGYIPDFTYTDPFANLGLITY